MIQFNMATYRIKKMQTVRTESQKGGRDKGLEGCEESEFLFVWLTPLPIALASFHHQLSPDPWMGLSHATGSDGKDRNGNSPPFHPSFSSSFLISSLSSSFSSSLSYKLSLFFFPSELHALSFLSCCLHL